MTGLTYKQGKYRHLSDSKGALAIQHRCCLHVHKAGFFILWLLHMSLVVRKPVFGVSDQSDTNQAVQPQRKAKALKFLI